MDIEEAMYVAAWTRERVVRLLVSRATYDALLAKHSPDHRPTEHEQLILRTGLSAIPVEVHDSIPDGEVVVEEGR